MKRIVLHAFFFLIVFSRLHAGWVITEKATYPDNTVFVTQIYFQNNLVKTVEGENVTIFDLNRRELTFLNLQTKTFWKGNVEKYKREVKEITIERIREEMVDIPEDQRVHYRDLYENLLRDMENPAPAFYSDVETRVEMTAEQKSILGYNTRKYKLYSKGIFTEEIWLGNRIKVSSDVNLETFRLFLNEISFGNMESDHRDSREYLHLMNSGYPLTSIELTEEGEILTEVTKVERIQLPQNEFIIPEGFEKSSLVDFGNF